MADQSLKATFMDNSSWFAKLEQTQTSYLLLAMLAVTVLAAGILYQIGLIGWVLRGLGMIVRGGIRRRLPALGTSARVGVVAAVPGDRLRFSSCRWSGRWATAGLEGLVRLGHPVHGGHRLPGLHVHRPGTE